MINENGSKVDYEIFLHDNSESVKKFYAMSIALGCCINKEYYEHCLDLVCKEKTESTYKSNNFYLNFFTGVCVKHGEGDTLYSDDDLYNICFIFEFFVKNPNSPLLYSLYENYELSCREWLSCNLKCALQASKSMVLLTYKDEIPLKAFSDLLRPNVMNNYSYMTLFCYRCLTDLQKYRFLYSHDNNYSIKTDDICLVLVTIFFNKLFEYEVENDPINLLAYFNCSECKDKYTFVIDDSDMSKELQKLKADKIANRREIKLNSYEKIDVKKDKCKKVVKEDDRCVIQPKETKPLVDFATKESIVKENVSLFAHGNNHFLDDKFKELNTISSSRFSKSSIINLKQSIIVIMIAYMSHSEMYNIKNMCTENTLIFKTPFENYERVIDETYKYLVKKGVVSNG